MARLYRDAAAEAPGPYVLVRVEPDVRGIGDTIEPGAPVWEGLERITWGPPEFPTAFCAAWSSSGLWFRFDCTDTEPWHTMRRRDDCLWNEEVVELFVDPLGRGRDYAEIEINPANVVCDVRVRTPWPDLVSDLTWDAEGLVTLVSHWPGGGASGWTATGYLPWTALLTLSAGTDVVVPPHLDTRWAFNVFRIKRPGGAAAPERDAIYAAWSVPDGPSFHAPSAFQPLVFGA